MAGRVTPPTLLQRGPGSCFQSRQACAAACKTQGQPPTLHIQTREAKDPKSLRGLTTQEAVEGKYSHRRWVGRIGSERLYILVCLRNSQAMNIQPPLSRSHWLGAAGGAHEAGSPLVDSDEAMLVMSQPA